MELEIDSNQFVCIDSHFKVRFHHKTSLNILHVLTLTSIQFFNLDDLMKGIQYLSKLSWFLLGGRLWLYKKGKCVQLVDNEKERFFRFYEAGWNHYKSNFHPLISSFLHHALYPSHHQPHARDESGSKNLSRTHLSSLWREDKILSGSSRNGRHAN